MDRKWIYCFFLWVWKATETIGLGLVKQGQLSEVEQVIILWSTEIAIWSTGGPPYSNWLFTNVHNRESYDSPKSYFSITITLQSLGTISTFSDTFSTRFHANETHLKIVAVFFPSPSTLRPASSQHFLAYVYLSLELPCNCTHLIRSLIIMKSFTASIWPSRVAFYFCHEIVGESDTTALSIGEQTGC